ncbi:putative cell surface protein [Methanoculleus bourgensis MS2]|uniref:Cell surface protein n=1 Tax=Methanoculleus bourgensis (strain ATCC 43281 / DSM 3045 / OCM 15 / MS2) TaxID=1201294 RepID=I7KCG4_METBM|nr:protease inhibitor I42 family protein [Methanoculleus bourgensis]CCJ36001.1 putative cell surface protein [Methanoculleus bourgensis MS2]
MKHVFLLVCILILTLTVGVSGAPVQVTTDRSDQIAPAIDGDRIVWVDGRDGGADIYLYDIVGATETRITNGTAVALWPDISGNRIVWQDNRSGAPDIWLYDTATGNETRITDAPGGQVVPAIDGDTVVWLDNRAGPAGGIYAMNLTTRTAVRVSSGPVQGNPLIVSPDVSGGTIVWADGSGGNYTVFAVRDAAEPVALANDSALQGFPAVASDRVVWSEIRNGSASLVVHNLTTGEEERVWGRPPGMAVYPDIAGDLVVWQNATGQDTDDIYLLDLAAEKTLQVTDDDALQLLPRVSGSRVVWMDNRSGDWDIYLLTAGNATQYTFGMEQNGQNVTVPVKSEVVVNLAENPTTGYSWNATVSPGLTITKDRYLQNATAEGMLGAGGTHTWTLVPEASGVFTFSAVYRRPWENLTGTEERFDLTITAVNETV